MGLRRAGLAVVLLLMAAAVRAGDHRFAAFIAPSFLDAKGSKLHLWGWHVMGEVTFKDHPRFGMAGDLSMHFLGGDGSTEGAEPAQITFLVGPRVEFRGHHTTMPFVHAFVLGGVYRSGVREGQENIGSGALAAGGGCDFAPGANRSWSIRIQVDYLLPVSSSLGHGWRYSAGLLYRFHGEGTPHQVKRKGEKAPAPPRG
jgi:hypothetical protein